jgi:hypothetical protein
VSVAGYYALAHDTLKSLAWLERALPARDPNLPYIGVLPMFRDLRQEDRFHVILGALALPVPEAPSS